MTLQIAAIDFGCEQSLDVAKFRSQALDRPIDDLGATNVADKAEWGISWSALTDIEGNEFCLAAHR